MPSDPLLKSKSPSRAKQEPLSTHSTKSSGFVVVSTTFGPPDSAANQYLLTSKDLVPDPLIHRKIRRLISPVWLIELGPHFAPFSRRSLAVRHLLPLPHVNLTFNSSPVASWTLIIKNDPGPLHVREAKQPGWLQHGLRIPLFQRLKHIQVTAIFLGPVRDHGKVSRVRVLIAVGARSKHLVLEQAHDIKETLSAYLGLITPRSAFWSGNASPFPEGVDVTIDSVGNLLSAGMPTVFVQAMSPFPSLSARGPFQLKVVFATFSEYSAMDSQQIAMPPPTEFGTSGFKAISGSPAYHPFALECSCPTDLPGKAKLGRCAALHYRPCGSMLGRQSQGLPVPLLGCFGLTATCFQATPLAVNGQLVSGSPMTLEHAAPCGYTSLLCKATILSTTFVILSETRAEQVKGMCHATACPRTLLRHTIAALETVIQIIG
ncbi:hypothetical protein NMY22_g11273 [Coprinellus aureogranulatus]|nr:hypothetical protein NMY22_g11273 [Coprinellus aureogranulatus]